MSSQNIRRGRRFADSLHLFDVTPSTFREEVGVVGEERDRLLMAALLGYVGGVRALSDQVKSVGVP